MSLFKNLLVARSERHLRKYRGPTNSPHGEFLRQYHSYLPLIERCYTHAGYWHGTGRYQYRHARESRYENSDSHCVANVFESILDAGALQTHRQELWVTHDGEFKETVSVAPTRMHARLYSHIHLREGVWLEYVFGGTRFWTGFFVLLGILQLVQRNQLDKRTSIKFGLLSKNIFAYGRVWASAVCNLDKYKISPLWRVYDLRSDIVGNHGVLFGIKHEATQHGDVFTIAQSLEVRVDHAIPLTDMTHIEVPLKHVEETKKLLEEKKISLPVIPLEFGELYCSQFPLSTLVQI
jgi:hypothetical protein